MRVYVYGRKSLRQLSNRKIFIPNCEIPNRTCTCIKYAFEYFYLHTYIHLSIQPFVYPCKRINRYGISYSAHHITECSGADTHTHTHTHHSITTCRSVFYILNSLNNLRRYDCTCMALWFHIVKISILIKSKHIAN